MLKQIVRNEIQKRPVFRQDPLAFLVTGIHDVPHFLVDLLRHTGGIIRTLGIIPAQEHIALGIRILDRAQA